MFLTLTVIIVLIALLYLYTSRNFNHWKEKNVDYLNPVPFFGNVFEVCTLQISIGQFLEKLHLQTDQPYFGFFVLNQPILLIRDSALIKQCLITDFDHFSDRSVAENRRDDELGSDILFILKNPKWKTLRSKVTAIFATGKLKSFLPLMIEASKDLTEYLVTKAINENVTDARDMSMKFTTDIIASCAFGINARCFHNEKAEFREVSRRFFDWNLSRKVQMASFYVSSTLVKMFKMKFVEPNAGNFLKRIFNEAAENRIASKTYRGDLVDHFNQLAKQTSDSSDNIEWKLLVAQAIQFFMGGYETTGSTISFALHCLSVFPHTQKRLREEIIRVINKHGDVTYDAIQEMEYLDMTIKETLRMYPVLPFVDRRCSKSYRIPGTDTVIEKGTAIFISLLGLHYDPKNFPNPEIFEPERFTFERRRNMPAYGYMPFGGGPRNCIGARFGVLGAKVGLVHILKDFEVELYGNSCFPLQHDTKGILIAPDDHKVSLRFKRHIPKTAD